ncbi:pentapeptide repeat-containing protein [Bounagaea algeriensis]
MTGSDLSEADLWGTDLRGAVLTGCRLRDADLSTARLDGADLRGSDLGELTADAPRHLRGAIVSPGAGSADLRRAGRHRARAARARRRQRSSVSSLRTSFGADAPTRE